MSEMGIYGGRTNRDRVLALVAEGDLVLAAGMPAHFGLATVGMFAVVTRFADVSWLTGMLGLANAPAFVPRLNSAGGMDTICHAALFARLRVGSRPLLDRAHCGGRLGHSYGRFSNDGRLGDILVRVLLFDFIRLGR